MRIGVRGSWRFLMAAQLDQPSRIPATPAVVAMTGVDAGGEQLLVLGLDVVVAALVSCASNSL